MATWSAALATEKVYVTLIQVFTGIFREILGHMFAARGETG